MPVMLATWEAEIRIVIQINPDKEFMRLYLEKNYHEKELVE
jgi:hypothetical protein